MDTLAIYGATYLNVDVFCIIMAVVIIRKVDESFGSELEIRYFKRMIGYYLLFCLTDALWMPVNSGFVGILPLANALLSTINMISVTLVSYFWFCYAQIRMHAMRLETARDLALSQIPLMALIALYALNPLTFWMFSIDGTGSFIQGPLYYITGILGGGYVVVVAAQALAQAQQATSRAQRTWYATFMQFGVLPACAIVIDLFVPNTPVVALGVLTSILFVFSNLQDMRIFNDALTGLNNRRRADQYISQKIADIGKTGAVYLFVLDINLFKAINDTRGHIEGDHALQVVANGLRRAAGASHGFVARWGGDEFVLVVDAQEAVAPDDVVGIIDRSLEQACADAALPYRITVSTGYAVCTSDQQDPDDLIMQADRMLYERKREAHGAA